MQEKTLLIAGHSHVSALINRPLKRDADPRPYLCTIEHSSNLLQGLTGEWPRTKNYWDELVRHGKDKIVVLLWKGNSHLSHYLIAPRHPIDLVASADQNLPINNNAALIPETALIELFTKTSEIDLLVSLVADLKKVNSIPILCCSPPPKEDDGFIRANLHREPTFIRQCKVLGIEPNAVKFSPPLLRYKLWCVLQTTYRKIANRLGIPFFPAPATVKDLNGFLPRNMYSNDSTHANAVYGEIIKDELVAFTKENTI